MSQSAQAPKVNVINNLIDFLPSGSFALYKYIESIINLPSDPSTCNVSQRVFMVIALCVSALFVFVTTLYPTDSAHPGNIAVTGGIVTRLGNKILLTRSILAIIAFIGLALTPCDFLGCVFQSCNSVVSSVMPLLLAAVCTSIERILSDTRVATVTPINPPLTAWKI